MPAYNEERTVGLVIDRLFALKGLDLEVIVVDDGSTDRTAEVVEHALSRCGGALRLIRHDRNRGKGAAIRSALPLARGELAVNQDADLECDPRDLIALERRFSDPGMLVVYGSRWLCRPQHAPLISRLGSRLLSVVAKVLYGARLTDLPTAYKMFRADLLRSLDLRENGFAFCAEVTARVLGRQIEIVEVPVSYTPRTRREGKKVRWRDGLRSLRVLVALRRSRGAASIRARQLAAEARP